MRIPYLYSVHICRLNGRSEHHGYGHHYHQYKRHCHGCGYNLFAVLFAKRKRVLARIFYSRAYARHRSRRGVRLFFIRISALRAKLIPRLMRSAAHGALIQFRRLISALRAELAAEHIPALGALYLSRTRGTFRLFLCCGLLRFRLGRFCLGRFCLGRFCRLSCLFLGYLIRRARLFAFLTCRAAPRAKPAFKLLAAFGTDHTLLLTFPLLKIQNIYAYIYILFLLYHIYPPHRQVLIKVKKSKPAEFLCQNSIFNNHLLYNRSKF